MTMQVPAETRDIPVLQCVQTSSGTHPVFYSVGTGGSFSGVKHPDHQTMKQTTYLHLTLRLRMIGVIPLLQAFTASTGTTLLDLSQENTASKKQQFAQAMEADTLLLILL
jgi:hypothetical protein